MRLFQVPLNTCLANPFFASLSVHGLHYTAYAASSTVERALQNRSCRPPKSRRGLVGAVHTVSEERTH